MVYSLRVNILALLIKRNSKVVYSRKRIKVRLIKHLFAYLKRLTVYSLCIGILALANTHSSEAAYSRKR